MPLPPSLSGQPRLGSSPIATPTGSPGAQAGAMSKVREAINILNGALPEFPVGTEIHQALMSAVQSLSKKIPPSNEALGVQQSTLRDLQQNAGKNAMLQQVMASLGAGGAQPGGAPSPLGASPAPQ